MISQHLRHSQQLRGSTYHQLDRVVKDVGDRSTPKFAVDFRGLLKVVPPVDLHAVFEVVEARAQRLGYRTGEVSPDCVERVRPVIFTTAHVPLFAASLYELERDAQGKVCDDVTRLVDMCAGQTPSKHHRVIVARAHPHLRAIVAPLHVLAGVVTRSSHRSRRTDDLSAGLHKQTSRL
ncbi:hypothetical protein L1857_34575 [Amycolatopsis thermalba]|uniref:Uncharacterized protein n=1 Tax=Amycolatopsis thermalba TaxID=944492 RepID=A0ABY4P566_9PSEU|nr:MULTISPECIES: hypothetical protein [Amycolatopsis]UQS27560.1 hypothetical protein L1857_34575 [Amycolatopsis thermalba]